MTALTAALLLAACGQETAVSVPESVPASSSAPAGSTALSFDGLFEKEIAHFIDCITTGIPCRSPAEDGIELMRILDAVYQSAKEGREVAIER